MDSQLFLRENYLRTAFDMLDKDKSGKIDVHEIMEMLGEDQMKDITVTRE
jgi:Ca2+-binding EF-hand superfamily protein